MWISCGTIVRNSGFYQQVCRAPAANPIAAVSKRPHHPRRHRGGSWRKSATASVPGGKGIRIPGPAAASGIRASSRGTSRPAGPAPATGSGARPRGSKARKESGDGVPSVSTRPCSRSFPWPFSAQGAPSRKETTETTAMPEPGRLPEVSGKPPLQRRRRASFPGLARLTPPSFGGLHLADPIPPDNPVQVLPRPARRPRGISTV